MNDPIDRRAVLASLGHASRYRLALCLLEGAHCVGDLARRVGLSQSCTTRHVQVLERAGVVKPRRDGKRVLVEIDQGPAGIAEMLRWLLQDAGAPGVVRGATPVGRPASGRAPAGVPGVRARGRVASRAASEEQPPAEVPPSGTNPGPAEAPPSQPRRPPQPIEDYLL